MRSEENVRWRMGGGKGNATFNTFWSTQLKNCAIKALHEIKISTAPKWTKENWIRKCAWVCWMADVVVFMSLQFTMPPLESAGGERSEKCGIKVIHVMLTFFDCAQKYPQPKRHVIEQKWMLKEENSAWETEKPSKQNTKNSELPTIHSRARRPTKCGHFWKEQNIFSVNLSGIESRWCEKQHVIRTIKHQKIMDNDCILFILFSNIKCCRPSIRRADGRAGTWRQEANIKFFQVNKI